MPVCGRYDICFFSVSTNLLEPFQMLFGANETKNIIIVGAGIAGLTCARELSKCNDHLTITVLEASDCIGGRVKSMLTKDGTAIEMGAQFIHGTIGNPIFDYAVQKGIIDPESIRGSFFDKVKFQTDFTLKRYFFCLNSAF